MSPGEFRLRICYAKSGRMRWLSHLEILRALERSIRRSQMPYALTQGFNPHMKAAFGPALPVGTAGLREYADIWLTRYTAPEDAFRALSAASPSELAPVEVRYAGDKEPSLAAALTIAEYGLEVAGPELDAPRVEAALRSVLKQGVLEIQQKGKTKVFDLARSVPKDVRIEAGDGAVRVGLHVRMGPTGSLRPELLLGHALGEAGIEVSAVRTTRLELFIESDDGQWSRPV